MREIPARVWVRVTRSTRVDTRQTNGPHATGALLARDTAAEMATNKREATLRWPPLGAAKLCRGYGLVTKVTAADPTTDPTKRSSRALMAPRSTRPADGT